MTLQPQGQGRPQGEGHWSDGSMRTILVLHQGRRHTSNAMWPADCITCGRDIAMLYRGKGLQEQFLIYISFSCRPLLTR